jgi:hypothetical protein
VTQREAFADHEWRALQLVPLAAYHAVGCADGSVSPAETNQYLVKLAQVAQLTAPATALAREVFESVRDDHDQVLRRFDDARLGGMTPDLVLREASELLDRVPDPAQAQAFRHVVRVLCQAVAEAAPLVGEKVTAQEQAAIERVTALLGPA